MMKTADPVLQAMIEIIADVLAVEHGDVKPESRFFTDLPGESIEVLETQFQVKKRFGIEVEFGKLVAGNTIAVDPSGRVPPSELQRLAAQYPFLPIHRLPPNPRLDDLRDLLTVGVMAEVVRNAVATVDHSTC